MFKFHCQLNIEGMNQRKACQVRDMTESRARGQHQAGYLLWLGCCQGQPQGQAQALGSKLHADMGGARRPTSTPWDPPSHAIPGPAEVDTW